jgi:hypothetical protein
MGVSGEWPRETEVPAFAGMTLWEGVDEDDAPPPQLAERGKPHPASP